MSSSPDNVQRLLDAGIAPRELVAIAKEAAFAYDVNRKPGGNTIGALGRSGIAIYESMLRGEDWEPDASALLTFKPFTAEKAVNQASMQRNTAIAAVNRLVEHGFMEKERSGRSFLARLMVPDLALTEYAERNLDAYEPNMAGYHEHQHLAEKVLSLYPRSSE